MNAMKKTNSSSTVRNAISLIELLVVLAMIAVLLGLLLPAIQHVRQTAMRTESANGIRQTLLATHNFASVNNGTFPDVDGSPEGEGHSVIGALSPYLEADRHHPPKLIRFPTDPSRELPVVQSVDHPDPILGYSSMAVNPYIYTKSCHFPESISDGTTSTLAITEHYGRCHTAGFDRIMIQNTCYEYPSFERVKCSSDQSNRRTTFADGKMYHDVIPVTTNSLNGPITTGSLPLTFQVRPPLDQCDPRIPQSSFAGGILCGFADGSVRFIRASVSENAFWSSVTPDQGEVVQFD
jgi:hypothetical protein